MPYETYNYDYYEDIKYTPAAYVPDGTVTGDVIGCGNFSSPQDLNTDADGNVYIADTGNNRIVVTDSDFQLKTVIGIAAMISCTTAPAPCLAGPPATI